MKDLFRNKNFIYLLTGETVSNIGDQFTFIALPWLVLKLTDNSAVLGAVLALAGIPRAVFMLLGGAITDHLTPKKMMQVSNLVRFILVSAMAALTLTGKIEIWHLYILSFGFGLADAFFMPAQTAIVPKAVEKDQLEKANTFIHGSMQLSQFVGPMLVGVLIGLFDRGNSSFLGIGLAFAIDALTFLVSLITLAKICGLADQISHEEGVLPAIKSGMIYVWRNIALRYAMLMIAIINFLIIGPFSIGIPVLVKNELGGGAAAYGSIMSAWGVGALIGYALTSIWPLAKKYYALALFGETMMIGIFMALFGLIHNVQALVGLSFIMAIFDGYIYLLFISWLQRSIPEKIMGRVMSIMMFFAIGLMPLSQALAGIVIKISLAGTFMVAGGLISLVAILIYLVPEVRKLGQEELPEEVGSIG